MQLQVDESLIQTSLVSVRESLAKKISEHQESLQQQSMAVDVLSFLAQQVLIPIIVSLTSCTIYDILKGRMLSHIGAKEAKKAINGLHRHTVNTTVLLTDDCMKALLELLSPLGFSEKEINIIYKDAIDALESRSKRG